MSDTEPEEPAPNENENEMTFSLEIALRMIPEFSGNKDDFHKFLTCCEIVYAMCTTNGHKTSLLNVIKTKLNGPAYNLIKYRTFETFDSLKQALSEQYAEKRTVAQIQSELLNCKQGKDDVREFANKIEKITSDLTDACIKSQGADA